MNSARISTVKLGEKGPLVGVQGLGCMGMSEFYGATDEAEVRDTLEHALALGVTLFDTADMYGCGTNETLLAPFVRAHRNDVVISTKYGFVRSVDAPDDWRIDNRPEYIRAAVERSLQRLGIDCIDLYYMHRRDKNVPLEDSIGAMADLVKTGKVQWLGLCEASAQELQVAHAIHPIAALQSEWSVFTRGIEQEVVAAARALGIAIVPYAPLGRGLLTGRTFAETLTAADARQQFPRFSQANRLANMRLVEQIEELAVPRAITTAQLALAWLYTRAEQSGVTVVPIPGTRKRSRLEENVAASGLRLTDAEMAHLDPLAASVQGMAI